MSAVGIIDYGAGNLKSIGNGVKKAGFDFDYLTDPKDLVSVTHLILPGVGSFGNAMGKLQKFKQPIREFIDDQKQFLGVCLGIQLIFDESAECPGVRGLGLLEGKCRRFDDELKVPHMGWNNINIKKETPLLSGIKNDDYFYFVHSYYSDPKDKDVVAAETDYGIEFASIISQDNIYATQFHPEKSGEAGLRILENFLNL
ncbi:MAG: imidazole glycerol phosphate synthase subunit HisH [Candidatus Altiarchaeota archaeon]